MILARAISADRPEDLELAFFRIGLPTAARDYARDKLPHLQVLVTGLGAAEIKLLRRMAEDPSSGGDNPYPRFIVGDPKRRPGAALLSGRQEQFERLLRSAQEGSGLGELSGAIDRLMRSSHPPQTVAVGSRTFEFGQRTHIMGVINVTPDSFSDGGEFLDATKAIERGLELAAAGADILDIGGESTRPGSAEVAPQLELERVLPVIRALRAKTDVPISIDTRKAAVAREAIAAGAALVNDVSGFNFDPDLPQVVADSRACCCLMHMRGSPETMQRDPRYGDIVEEVVAYLEDGISRAVSTGISRSRIFVDPGIGFGKTAGHNLFLLRRLRDLRVLGLPIVVGTSRKSFLGAIAGKPDPRDRLAATLGSVAAIAASGGADVIRVHDVAAAKAAIAIADAIRVATEGGSSFQST